MKRLNALRAACVALTLASAATACSKAESQQNQPANPGTTQPGSSAEQSRGSQPGAAKADCSIDRNGPEVRRKSAQGPIFEVTAAWQTRRPMKNRAIQLDEEETR